MRRAFLLLPLLLVGCSTKPKPIVNPNDPQTAGPTADPWPAAAATIRRQPDVGGVRQAVTQVTADLAGNTKATPVPALPPDAVQAVGDQLRLSPNERKEVASTSFTQLDSSYAGECLFFRDVVRSLDLGAHAPDRKAAFGFAWVCRQVYLRPGTLATPTGLQLMRPLPPQYVLFRGYGTGQERAYVFLAVLQQLGFEGCLIGLPNREQDPRVMVENNKPAKGPFWAVGAALPDGQIALFDPWRGEPFPGPNGTVGTLAQVQANPDVLKPWREDKNRPWDVSADQVKAATVYAAVPFPAVTPRIKLLEEKTAVEVGVKLSRDPAEALKRLGPAAKLWAPAEAQDPYCVTRVLETFLPTEEGGTDRTPAKDGRLYDYVTKRDVVPFGMYTPPADLSGPELLDRLQGLFYSTYLSTVAALNPREKVQRGQFNEIVRGLIDREQKLTADRDRGRSAAVSEEAVAAWKAEANTVFRELAAARLPQNQIGLPAAEQKAEKFLTSGGPVLVHFQDTLIVPGCLADVGYFLAVCKHEQAERAAIRLHRTSPADKARPEAERAAKEAWAVAKDAWDRYFAAAEPFLKNYPDRTPHLRRLAARAAKLAADPTAEW